VVSLSGLEHQAAVFPRNRRSLNSPVGGMARKVMHLARKEALPAGPTQTIDRNKQPDIKAGNQGFDAGRIFAPSRLKWLNSLYRPALPEGMHGRLGPAASPYSLLGRRQVVRQWILIPPYGGSNPPAPARF
jgi:hypothetical protein